MNLQLLIDSIIRQTTVLIAQLATAQGVRAPLANVANQVFLDLANELNEQGVSRKVCADMFGMALRTYQRKIQRLSESSTEQGRSLWEAVLSYVDEAGIATRADVLRRFHRDDAELVRGVLHDLCESALVFRTGTGAGTAYRVARPEELGRLGGNEEGAGGDELIWALIYREGPIGREALGKLARGKQLDAALARLLAAGRVREQGGSGGETSYAASEFFVPRDARVGWEAAVFDRRAEPAAARSARHESGRSGQLDGPRPTRAHQPGGSTSGADRACDTAGRTRASIHQPVRR
ncbi:MAG TPA: hypothetical protein VFS67_15410 [Polyangiaceae bacterium]|jgi:hypothetical protein|nr:hypothetical protein [Polyangiaceae bacterium]